MYNNKRSWFPTKSKSSLKTVSTVANFPENFLVKYDATSLSQPCFVATKKYGLNGSVA